jgi:hypothetical protein
VEIRADNIVHSAANAVIKQRDSDAASKASGATPNNTIEADPTNAETPANRVENSPSRATWNHIRLTIVLTSRPSKPTYQSRRLNKSRRQSRPP